MKYSQKFTKEDFLLATQSDIIKIIEVVEDDTILWKINVTLNLLNNISFRGLG